MAKSNKMSFDVDLDGLETDKSLREQVEDQLEDNGFEEEDIDSFNEGMDEFYGQQSEDDEDQEDDVEDDQDAGVDSSTTENQDVNGEAEDAQQVQQKEFGDRANKRIRELNAQKKKAFEEAELARKQQFEAKKEALDLRKSLLELKTKSLKAELEAAINDGDASKQVEVSAELAKLGSDLSRIEAQQETYKEYKPSKQEETQTESSDVFGLEFDHDKAAKLSDEWEFDNPRVMTDKVYADTSIKIGQQLMARGYKPDNEDFYKELTKRLNMAFGIQTTNSESNSEVNKTESAKVVVAKKNPPQKGQTVAGASRTPAPTTRTGEPSSKNGIRLDKNDIEIAKALGVDLKTYAANRSRVEKGMNEKGQIKVNLFDL